MTDAIPGALPPTDHGHLLSTLAKAHPGRLRALAEPLIDRLGDIEVVKSRTGLVMLPMRDTVKGTDFHLGEVLVAEAHIRVPGGEGYGMVVGRDLEHAMAMAVVDAAFGLGIARHDIADFVAEAAREHVAADRQTLRKIEATRVDMETF